MAFGGRCPSAIGDGGTGAPARSSVLKAISKRELTRSPFAKGAGAVQERHLDTSAADTWKTSREAAKGQNLAKILRFRPKAEAAAAERQHRIA